MLVISRAQEQAGVFLDGDYSDWPAELPLLLAPIIEGRADITLGSRLGKQNILGALPWHATFWEPPRGQPDYTSVRPEDHRPRPFRVGRADVLREFALEETTYGWAVEMILKAAIEGFRIVEVPVSYYWRIGKSKISGTLKGTVGAGVVHPQPHRGLLLSATKSPNSTASVMTRHSDLQ